MHKLIFSHANNKLPFLTFMVDSFSLDKTNAYIQQLNEGKKPTILQISDWIGKNKFVIELKPKAPTKTIERLTAAMKLYTSRNIPHLHFTPPFQIVDDIDEIIDYLISIPPFIKHLFSRQDIGETGPPFCVDVSFAVKQVEEVIKKDEDGNEEKDNAEDGDDDDDDDENENESKQQERKRLDPDEDHVGDLQQRLGDELLSFQPQNDKQDDEQSLSAIRRILTNGYNGLRTKLSENSHGDKERFNQASYPRFRRFGIFIDRRNKKKNAEAKDKITFFEVCHVMSCLLSQSYLIVQHNIL